MNNAIKLVLIAALLLVVAAGGYWLGTHSVNGSTAAAHKAERKVLYYRNPMGLPDTSPVPKKDSMGMDYVAVYEGDEVAGKHVSISLDKVQKLGVRSEATTMRILDHTLRVTGRIEIDERRTYTIAPKFEGWVDKLYVNTTGQTVSKGQPLFDVYSPELVSALRELELTAQGLNALKDADDEARVSMEKLADASAARLKNWGIGDTQLNKDRVTLRSPVTGIVLEKKAIQGMRFMPGEMLYQIADLSSVWIIAEVPEQDIGMVIVGSRAQATVDAYPDRSFDGKVEFIYPTLNSSTRTVQVRMVIANSKGMLRPAMYANVQIAAGKGDRVLVVPASAVIDSGIRQIVLVRLAEGRFEPRTVTLGSRGDNYVEVRSGLADGDQVVTSANFLIDSESNLKAALGVMGEATIQHSSSQGRSERGTHSVGHQAQGVLEAINPDGSVSITHEPIASLGWPGMTMDFALSNASLATGIQPGSKISFEIVERGEGEWVITKLEAKEPSHAEHNH